MGLSISPKVLSKVLSIIPRSVMRAKLPRFQMQIDEDFGNSLDRRMR